eukprot:1159589-Pelagomonas_calceolata.AAC.15
MALSDHAEIELGDMKMYKREAVLKNSDSEQHMFLILYVIGITGIPDWRSTGPNSLFKSKSVNSQPESGNVAKDMMEKILIHVFRQGIRRVNGMSSSGRKCARLMICQLLTVAYSGIRSYELIPVAMSRSQVHHKLTEVHRVTSHNSTLHQIRVCQTIQHRHKAGTKRAQEKGRWKQAAAWWDPLLPFCFPSSYIFSSLQRLVDLLWRLGPLNPLFLY